MNNKRKHEKVFEKETLTHNQKSEDIIPINFSRKHLLFRRKKYKTLLENEVLKPNLPDIRYRKLTEFNAWSIEFDESKTEQERKQIIDDVDRAVEEELIDLKKEAYRLESYRVSAKLANKIVANESDFKIDKVGVFGSKTDGPHIVWIHFAPHHKYEDFIFNDIFEDEVKKIVAFESIDKNPKEITGGSGPFRQLDGDRYPKYKRKVVKEHTDEFKTHIEKKYGIMREHFTIEYVEKGDYTLQIKEEDTTKY